MKTETDSHALGIGVVGDLFDRNAATTQRLCMSQQLRAQARGNVLSAGIGMYDAQGQFGIVRAFALPIQSGMAKNPFTLDRNQ